MSIASEITRINTNIANSYTAVDNKNGTLPQVQKSANLASAIESIEVIEQATAEGESLSLTNTKAMPYSDYVVKGKSEQDGEPSPSIPSEIHSVADDVNLFDKDTGIVNGFTYTSNGGTTSLASAFIQETYINVNPNTSYTLSTTNDYSTQDPGEYRLVICEYNASKTFIQRNLGSADVHNKYSIQTTSNTYYVRICASKVTINELKLQKGTVATPYSPYNQGTVTIKQRGKNLFDINDLTASTSEQTATGTILSNGIRVTLTTDGQYKYASWYINNVDEWLNKTLTISCVANASGNNNGRILLRWYSAGSVGTTIANLPATGGTFEVPLSIPSGYASILISFYANQSSTSHNINDYVEYINIQVEESLIPTSYEPYQTPHDYTFQTSPLRSLPNGVKDTIEADGIHRRVGRVVLNGTQPLEIVNWRPTETSVGWVYSRSITNNKKQTEGVINNILCNKLKAVSYASLFGNTVDEGINIVTQSNAYGLVIKIKDTSLTTANAINTYLSSNPITVQYELETEAIEPLTQNQATTMLDIIKTGSYEGTTNIYTDEDVKPTIGVEYYKKG